MSDLRGIIKHRKEMDTVWDEDELCGQYFVTDRITFGMSVLEPGKTGGLDKGHKAADEVFFCVKGHVLVYFPEDDHSYELKAGDALLIPPETGHRISNVGEEEAVITWSCAPHP